jgi:hypothetical protein
VTAPACELLNLGEQELAELHNCLVRVVDLGAKIAIVRARNREIIAQAEHDPAAWPSPDDALISRRLRRADLGVVARRELDLAALAHVASSIEEILERAHAARWGRR